MAIDFTKDKIKIDQAEYEYAGSCQQPECQRRLFQCVTHPVRADEQIGLSLCTFVAGAPNEPPVTYCSAHNPHAARAFTRRPVATDEQGNEYRIGDAYQPAGGWRPGI